mgnify:CR=1 FL=1
MEAYTGFAAVYDRFMDNVPYAECADADDSPHRAVQLKLPHILFQISHTLGNFLHSGGSTLPDGQQALLLGTARPLS